MSPVYLPLLILAALFAFALVVWMFVSGSRSQHELELAHLHYLAAGREYSEAVGNYADRCERERQSEQRQAEAKLAKSPRWRPSGLAERKAENRA